MKRYEHPTIKIAKFDVEDIITLSNIDIDGGTAAFPGEWIDIDIDGQVANFKW